MRSKRPFYVTDQRDDNTRRLTCVPESKWATFPNVKLFPDLPTTSSDCWGHRRWRPHRRGTADHSDTVWHCIQTNDPSVSQSAEWIKNDDDQSHQSKCFLSNVLIWQEVRTEVREECYLESAGIHVRLTMWTVAMVILTHVGVAVSCQGGVPCKGMIITPAMSDMW